MKWFSWRGWKANRRVLPKQKRQSQRFSVYRPASYDRPPRWQKPLVGRAWSGEQWQHTQRFDKTAPWFALSVAAHVLLLGAMATLMLPSSTKPRVAPVPVQLLPPQAPSHAMTIPKHLATAPETRESPASAAHDIAALQQFRADWIKRANRLEQRLVELAETTSNKEQTIELQHQQIETAQQEAQQLTDALAAKTAQEQQLATRLADEQARRAQLEAEIREQRERREAELRMAKESYQKLIADLQSEITRKDITIHEFRDQLAITIVDRVLFPSGQATLTPEGRRILEKVGQVLARGTDRLIQIEGHTDNQEIGPELKKRFASNWELSTARATEVVRYILAHTPLPAERLLAVGRADTRPVASNMTEAGRQQNRRIEIILLPPPDKLQHLAQGSQKPPG